MSIRGFLMGVGLGAGMAYLLDPDHAESRQTMLRDKVTNLRGSVNDLLDWTSTQTTDLQTRAQGLMEDARNRIETARSESESETQTTANR